MIVTQEPAQNIYYKEDVNSTTGEALVTSPCVVYDITTTNDTGATIVVSFHDAATATAASKKIKMVVAANSSLQYTFPRGRKFTLQVFAKPNAAGVDVGLSYD